MLRGFSVAAFVFMAQLHYCDRLRDGVRVRVCACVVVCKRDSEREGACICSKIEFVCVRQLPGKMCISVRFVCTRKRVCRGPAPAHARSLTYLLQRL